MQSKDLLVFLEVRLQMAAVEEVVREGKTVVLAVLAVEVRAPPIVLVALQLKQPMD
jgi:hypothetical protein